ncbi:MAG: helix-turn-helix transcriptional regulator [Bacteroidia bacterium]|nr:helix-turn-helix transcriptional regulator [Bacteroidia bacterium]
MRRDTFQAIADPTRREILNQLAYGSLNVNSIAGNFNVSRVAISKHIKILTECGLIIIKQEGRERFCEAKFEKLTEVSEWVEQYKKFWLHKLDALEAYLEKIQAAEQLILPAKQKQSTGTKNKLITKKKKNVKHK